MNDFIKKREVMHFFGTELQMHPIKELVTLKIKDASLDNPLIEYLLKFGQEDN